MPEPIDRRAFNVAWAYALLGGAAIALIDCGGGSSTGPSGVTGATDGNNGGGNPTATPTQTVSGDKVGQISNNHGHIAIITAAELVSGGGLLLNIQGNAAHNHVVTLSGGEVKSIAAGATVAKLSSSANGHQHMVTFN